MSCNFVTADSLLLVTLSIDGQIVCTVFGALNLSLHCLRTWFGEKLLLRKASIFCEVFRPPTSAIFLFSFFSLKTGMSERSVSSAVDLSPHRGLRVVELCLQKVCTSQSSGLRHTFEVTLCVEEFKVTPCVEEFGATLCFEEFEVTPCVEEFEVTPCVEEFEVTLCVFGVEVSKVTLCVCEVGTLSNLVTSRLLTRSVMLCMSPLRLLSTVRT